MSRSAVGWLLALACAAGGCAGEKAAEQRPTVRRPATGRQADLIQLLERHTSPLRTRRDHA